MNCKPSEPYLAKYLLEVKGLSEQQLDSQVWPWYSYAALFFMLPVGLAAETFGYRQARRRCTMPTPPPHHSTINTASTQLRPGDMMACPGPAGGVLRFDFPRGDPDDFTVGRGRHDDGIDAGEPSFC